MVNNSIEIPAFSVVGSKALVKGLDGVDLKNAGPQVVLTDTYNLHLRPATDVVKKIVSTREFIKQDSF